MNWINHHQIQTLFECSDICDTSTTPKDMNQYDGYTDSDYDYQRM